MNTEINIGIDTSQSQLDIFVRPLNVFFSVENTLPGVKDAVKKLCSYRPQRVLIEATGRLEMTFVSVAHKAGLAVVVCNAWQVRKFAELVSEIGEYQDKLTRLDRLLKQLIQDDPVGRCLIAIPGIGVIIASAAMGRVSDIHAFKRGRAFASWLGITPREYSSGSTRTLGRITRQGDSYLRMLLIHGARAALLAAKRYH